MPLLLAMGSPVKPGMTGKWSEITGTDRHCRLDRQSQVTGAEGEELV